MESLKKDAGKLFLLFFLCISLVFMAAGVIVGGAGAFSGLVRVMTSSEKLVTDVLAEETGGFGGGLLSVGLVGLISWAVLKFSGAKIGGASFGAFFLMIGLGFYGKNPLNILPILLGTFLYSKVKKVSFGSVVNMGLFACALAPAVSEMMFGSCNPWSQGVGILVGVLVGVLIGFVFAPLAGHVAGMHKGYNLYNAGLTAGLLGILLGGMYKQLVLAPAGTLGDYAVNAIKGEPHQMFFNVFLGAILAATLVFGAVLNGGFGGFGSLLKRTGYKTDLSALDGGPLCLINFAVLGAFGLVYMNLVKAPFTGPVIGAFLSMLCWAANGSHVRNVWPIFAGYALVSLCQSNGLGWLGGQGIVLGIYFASGLSPISGRYRFWWGIAAGALHACIVSYTGGFHAWLNCYNGGFTSGLVAMVLIAILEAFVPEKHTVQ